MQPLRGIQTENEIEFEIFVPKFELQLISIDYFVNDSHHQIHRITD